MDENRIMGVAKQIKDALEEIVGTAA